MEFIAQLGGRKVAYNAAATFEIQASSRGSYKRVNDKLTITSAIHAFHCAQDRFTKVRLVAVHDNKCKILLRAQAGREV